jgi:DNA polymerase-3 subunit epsilon
VVVSAHVWRGYRWSDGSDGRPKSWYVDVDGIALDDEIAFLKTEIYLRDVEPRLQTLTAFTRFSIERIDRILGHLETFPDDPHPSRDFLCPD